VPRNPGRGSHASAACGFLLVMGAGGRKEARVRAIIAERGDHPGLVHIFSVLEPCSCYRPWHEKSTGRTFLKPVGGKCLHYYFYLIDPEYGLVYVRVTTW